MEQDGAKSVKVLITNHCTDCDNVSCLLLLLVWGRGLGAGGWVLMGMQVPGHFDINQAPQGWNNPRIYWKKLDDSECY